MGSHSSWKKNYSLKVINVFFFGYSKDLKVYKLLQPHSNEIINERYVKFDENILACRSNSVIVSFFTCEPSSNFVPPSLHMLVSFQNDETKDQNPPLSTHIPLDESIEYELAPTPHFENGSIQDMKPSMTLSLILQTNVILIDSSSDPLFWLNLRDS